MKRYISVFVVPILLFAACGGTEPEATTTTTIAPQTTTTDAGSEITGAADGLVAQEGDSVAVHYVGTLDDGSEFDSSRGGEPLPFVVGSGQMISGFDAAVHGMAVGDVKTVRIPAEEAYGDVDPELVFSVPIDEAPEGGARVWFWLPTAGA